MEKLTFEKLLAQSPGFSFYIINESRSVKWTLIQHAHLILPSYPKACICIRHNSLADKSFHTFYDLNKSLGRYDQVFCGEYDSKFVGNTIIKLMTISTSNKVDSLKKIYLKEPSYGERPNHKYNAE